MCSVLFGFYPSHHVSHLLLHQRSGYNCASPFSHAVYDATYWPEAEEHPLIPFTHHTGQGYLKCLYFLWLHFDNTQTCPDHIPYSHIPIFSIFMFPLFCWKTWILHGNKSCSSQKGTATDATPQQKTRQKQEEPRKTLTHFFSCSGKVNARWRRMMFKSLDVLYVHMRGLKRNHCWSSRFGSSHIALRMLLCTVWVCAQDSLWDPGRRGFCCLHCRSGRLIQYIKEKTRKTNAGSVGPILQTHKLAERI